MLTNARAIMLPLLKYEAEVVHPMTLAAVETRAVQSQTLKKLLKDTLASHLTDCFSHVQVGPVKCYPLYSTLPPAQQQRIFEPVSILSNPVQCNHKIDLSPQDYDCSCALCIAMVCIKLEFLLSFNAPSKALFCQSLLHTFGLT